MDSEEFVCKMIKNKIPFILTFTALKYSPKTKITDSETV